MTPCILLGKTVIINDTEVSISAITAIVGPQPHLVGSSSRGPIYEGQYVKLIVEGFENPFIIQADDEETMELSGLYQELTEQWRHIMRNGL